MSLELEKKRITNYLKSDKSWPLIVDLKKRSSIEEITNYFNVGVNRIKSAQAYCKADGVINFDELYYDISNNEGDLFITELSPYLMVNGERLLEKTIKTIINKNITGHVVVLTYQCEKYLAFKDPRISESGRIVIEHVEPDDLPTVILVNKEVADAFPDAIIGFDQFAHALERTNDKNLYIVTDISKGLFTESLYRIEEISDSYSILCSKDERTKKIARQSGTTKHWNYILKTMGGCGNWNTVLDKEFGNEVFLTQSISSFSQFDPMKQWVYFSLLSIVGTSNNEYLSIAVKNAIDVNEFVNSLFRSIMMFNPSDDNFKKLYSQRKDILKNFTSNVSEINNYCRVLAVKGKESIYYLTDLTQQEKERVIEWLNDYGEYYKIKDLILILKDVYPELGMYLNNFRLKNPFLDNYFENYRYQKVINKVLPSFATIVDEQAHELGFLSMLKPRSAILDKLSLENTEAYFVDAMGVEYLPYIQAKCSDYQLATNINVGRCELPSLTVFNKDFLNVFQNNGIRVRDVKDLDEIKHHGENNYDYEKVKTPIYLIRELEIIDNLLKSIKAALNNGKYQKAILISDHGASRLAVLNDTENIWKMETAGVHSGRCCPQKEIDVKLDTAISSEGFWVLTNYDRFQGGRKANCEVHGGASIEEVAVPIIEITLKKGSIEGFILDDSKVITIGAKETPILKVYCAIESDNLCVEVEGRYYDAVKTNTKYIYEVALDGISRKGRYVCDIINGNDVIAHDDVFEIKKKGMSEISLFD